jgi:hypothetical protein
MSRFINASFCSSDGETTAAEEVREPKKLNRDEVGVEALEADDVLRRLGSGASVDTGDGALGRENQVGKRFRGASSVTAGKLDRVLAAVGLLSPVNDMSTERDLGWPLESL